MLICSTLWALRCFRDCFSTDVFPLQVSQRRTTWHHVRKETQDVAWTGLTKMWQRENRSSHERSFVFYSGFRADGTFPKVGGLYDPYIYISIKTDLRGRAIYMLKITDWNQYHYEVTAIEGKSKGSKTQQTISFAWHMLFHGQDKDPLASVEDGNCPHPMAVFSQWIYLPLECFWSKDSI